MKITDHCHKTWSHRGLQCMIGRSPFKGAFNGYVQLPSEHPAYGKHYDQIEADAHGGLTYGCDPDGWVGFDTLHGGDYWEGCKELEFMSRWGSYTTWTLELLREEVNRLADQLADMMEEP